LDIIIFRPAPFNGSTILACYLRIAEAAICGPVTSLNKPGMPVLLKMAGLRSIGDRSHQWHMILTKWRFLALSGAFSEGSVSDLLFRKRVTTLA
jgi:hypothetical protein